MYNSSILADSVGKIDGASYSFEDYTDTEVELVSLSAKEKGRGAGYQAMSKIIDAADGLSIDLMLILAGDSEKQERLSRFYQRFGFEMDSNSVMRRHYERNISLERPR